MKKHRKTEHRQRSLISLWTRRDNTHTKTSKPDASTHSGNQRCSCALELTVRIQPSSINGSSAALNIERAEPVVCHRAHPESCKEQGPRNQDGTRPSWHAAKWDRESPRKEHREAYPDCRSIELESEQNHPEADHQSVSHRTREAHRASAHEASHPTAHAVVTK